MKYIIDLLEKKIESYLFDIAIYKDLLYKMAQTKPLTSSEVKDIITQVLHDDTIVAPKTTTNSEAFLKNLIRDCLK